MLPGFLNVCLIMTVFSAANTTLYVSSRTLFGLARDLNYQGALWSRWSSLLGTTNPSTRVPAFAVILSAVSFLFLPFVHAGLDYSDQWVSKVNSINQGVCLIP